MIGAQDIKLKVAPEKVDAVNKVAVKWHLLAKMIGWKALAQLYIDRKPPFQDVRPLTGSKRQRLGRARQILIHECVSEMRDAGMEVV